MLVGRADRDADRVRRAEAGQRADDHALAEQTLEERRRVLAEIDVEEVADRAGSRLEAVALQDGRADRRGPAAFRPRRRAISPVSSRLASAATCAVVVRSNGRRTLAIAAQTSCGADGVADPGAGEAVDLRERAQDDDASPARGSTRRPRRGSRRGRCTRSTPGRSTAGRRPGRGRGRRRAPRGCSSSRSGCSDGRRRRSSSAARPLRRARRGRSGARGAGPVVTVRALLGGVDHVARERRPAADDLVARARGSPGSACRCSRRRPSRRRPPRSATPWRAASASCRR